MFIKLMLSGLLTLIVVTALALAWLHTKLPPELPPAKRILNGELVRWYQYEDYYICQFIHSPGKYAEGATMTDSYRRLHNAYPEEPELL